MEQLRISTEEASTYLSAGSFGVTEMILRQVLTRQPGDAVALRMMAGIARSVGESAWADEYQKRADSPGTAGAMQAALPTPAGANGFLLIKAWGNGFFSDLDHTLGHLLLAEMTGRTPIVHWGRNSLFSMHADRDAFSQFFEPVSTLTIDDLVGKGFDFFPPKWNDRNLRRENLNKLDGEWSLVPPIAYLNRPERIAVADVFAAVSNLVPWLRPGHPMHGRPVADVYRYLIGKYLKPVPDVQREIDEFAAAHFGQGPIIAAHVRGSDKAIEDPQLAQKISVYPQAISQLGAGQWFPRVFLLTDADPIRADFQRRYGSGLITTECTRSANTQGVHLQGHADRRRIGIEVYKDAALAARCDAFVGLGSSNVSCMIYHMKAWPANSIVIIGPVMTHMVNPYLYMTIDQRERFLPAEMMVKLRARAKRDREAAAGAG